MDQQHESASETKASMAKGDPYPPPYADVPQMGYPQPDQAQFGGYTQQPHPGQPYPGQVYPVPGQTVIAVQPTRAPLSPPESDYLGYSIFTLLCCCMPLGIAALIYSIFVREANGRGDRAEAARNSRLARILNHMALGFGLLAIVVVIIYVIVIFTAYN